MGLRIDNIIFKDGIPNFPLIQKKFSDQTGLTLNLVLDVNLLTLTADTTEIIAQLNTDKEQLSTLSYPRLKTDGFLPLYFFVKENMICIQSGIDDFYFLESLRKSLVDLGGHICNSDGDLSENWKQPESWKKLKKWSDYSSWKRPKK